MPLATRETVRERGRRQRSISERVTTAMAALWATTELGELENGWARLIGAAVRILSSGQRLAAAGSTEYVSELAGEQGVDPDPAGEVTPEGFAGTASDGRPLESLLAAPPIATRVAQASGASDVEAKRAGLLNLSMIGRTQVADAGRGAAQAATVAEPKVRGYERVVNLPACGRCIILAGRLYEWNEGFLRHPNCDCFHIPVTSEQWQEERPENRPDRLFDQMSQAEQDKAFTKAGAQAIRDGADPIRVVNARRGMSTAVSPSGRRRLTSELVNGRDVFVTSEGARRGRPRLMPEQIYRDATSRQDAVRLLRLHGYIR